jgi:hypothetical protein
MSMDEAIPRERLASLSLERKSGQATAVEVSVPARRLAHRDIRSHTGTIEPGVFHLTVGRFYGDPRLTTNEPAAVPLRPVEDRSGAWFGKQPGAVPQSGGTRLATSPGPSRRVAASPLWCA